MLLSTNPSLYSMNSIRQQPIYVQHDGTRMQIHVCLGKTILFPVSEISVIVGFPQQTKLQKWGEGIFLAKEPKRWPETRVNIALRSHSLATKDCNSCHNRSKRSKGGGRSFSAPFLPNRPVIIYSI